MIIYEGAMLPTETELNLARRCQFDIFTVTNFSVVELANYYGFSTRVLASMKRDIGNT
jgi:hypothetical protein